MNIHRLMLSRPAREWDKVVTFLVGATPTAKSRHGGPPPCVGPSS